MGKTWIILAGILSVSGMAQRAAAADFGLITNLYVQATGSNDQHTDYLYQNAQSTDPVVTDFTVHGAAHGASAYATAAASAFYGSLELTGSGFAAPSLDGAASRVTGFIGGTPQVGFYDTLYVGSDTLSPGSAVGITFRIDYSGYASFQSEGCCDRSSASFNSVYRLDSNGGDSLTAAFDIEHGLGVFHDTQMVIAHVGDTLRLSGGIFGSGEAASYDAGGGSNFSFGDPSTLSFTVDTAGARVTSASGGAYAAAAAPEPADWTLMVAGFGLVGSLLRTRKWATVRVA